MFNLLLLLCSVTFAADVHERSRKPHVDFGYNIKEFSSDEGVSRWSAVGYRAESIKIRFTYPVADSVDLFVTGGRNLVFDDSDNRTISLQSIGRYGMNAVRAVTTEISSLGQRSFGFLRFSAGIRIYLK